jgi:drug/metabolite transporter (DMT)-like permease
VKQLNLRHSSLRQNNKIIAYVKLICVILIWGGVYHVAKFLVSDTDIFTIAFIRFLIAATVLLCIYYKNRPMVINRDYRHWVILFWIGAIGIVGYTIVFFAAEALIDANDVAILYAFTPCLTVLLGHIFLKQKVKRLAYLGVIIAFLGTIAVISLTATKCNGKLICTDLVKNLSLGQVFAVLAAVFMSIYNILNKKAATIGLNPLTITTFGSLFGAVLLFIPFLFLGEGVHQIFHKSWMFWLATVYVSIFATVLSYKWYSDSIHYLGVGQTAVFLNMLPLAAVLIGVVLLGKSISIGVLCAGLVIISGVLITNYSVNKQKKSTQA